MTSPAVTGERSRHVVGYVVKSWPRLSETFILNEILGLERQGVSIRIFSVRDPDPGPVHSQVTSVRASVAYLSLVRRWRPVLAANARTALREPRRYFRTLLVAIGKVLRRRGWSAIRMIPLRHFLRAGYLADLLRRAPCTQLHAHFVSSPGLVALFTSQLTGVPYSLTAHAKDIYTSDSRDLRPKLRGARAVVTCTEYNRRYLLSRYGPECGEKLHLVYHGVDLTYFPQPAAHPTSDDEPLVLSVARLVEKKGLDDLIAAADLLRRRGLRFRVEIIGGGPMLQALAAEVRARHLEDVVAMVGACPQETVFSAYRRAAVFALPCKVAGNGDRDGIPNALLEAVASGVPIVATPVSGIPEVIESEHSGLLVKPSEPALLADALERILSYPDLGVRLAATAIVKLKELFSLEESAARLRGLFQQLPG